jgi:hypothetical protein
MKRIVPLLMTFVLFVLPLFALAHPHTDEGAWHPDSRLGWAIHRDGQWHVSEISDIDRADLSSKYGDDFLYIRDDEERFIITDPKLIDRATDATRRIQDHAKEISALANAEAELAMSRVHGTWERQRLQKLEAKLEDRIERGQSRGEDTRQMKQDLKQVRGDLDRLEKDGGEKLTETQRRDLRARRDEASEDLSEAIDGIRAEIRDILREAKDKDLARRIR